MSYCRRLVQTMNVMSNACARNMCVSFQAVICHFSRSCHFNKAVVRIIPNIRGCDGCCLSVMCNLFVIVWGDTDISTVFG